MHAHTFGVTIKAAPDKAFQYLSDVRNLLVWAPAFADSIDNQDGHWIARKGKRTFELRMVSDEHSGVLDLQIIPAPGIVAVAPSRVIPNGPHTEYVFTLFQSPGMDDITFEQTVTGMAEEFQLLKRALEG